MPSVASPILHPEQVESCQSPAEDASCTWHSFQRFLLASSWASLPLAAVILICFLIVPHALPVQAVLTWVSLISFPYEPRSLITFLLFFYGTENLQFPIYLFGYSFNFCKLWWPFVLCLSCRRCLMNGQWVKEWVLFLIEFFCANLKIWYFRNYFLYYLYKKSNLELILTLRGVLLALTNASSKNWFPVSS